MPNQHATDPIPYRPTVRTGLREWLLGHAAETGKAVNAVINEAVEAHRQRHSMNGGEVIHLDGDPRNNDPSNLEIRKSDQR